MADLSDSDLKTDEDDSPPPPRGKTRSSMDETEQLEQLQNDERSSSRPPPMDPPPPIPPYAPEKQEINNTSSNILLNLNEPTQSEKSSPKKSSPFSRNRNRRRRQSLPSINIFPSFKSLKNVMGFDVDDTDNDKQNDDDKNHENKSDNKNNKNKDKNDKNDNKNDKSKSQDTNKKSLNRKLNPKEIKQLYIKNLKLQSALDKYKEREKNLEYKLQERDDNMIDLKNQIKLKSEVLTQLNEKLNKQDQEQSDSDAKYKAELKKLKKLLVEKDTKIQTLSHEMNEITVKLNESSITQKQMTNQIEDYERAKHERVPTETVGGYDISSIHSLADEQSPNPSAPIISDDDNNDVPLQSGLSLEDRLKQRPTYNELKARGIQQYDENISPSIGKANKLLHRRKASVKLDNLFKNRPNQNDLLQKNILKSPVIRENEADNTYDHNINPFDFSHNMDQQKNDLNRIMANRPSWKSLHDKNILLDDPTTNKSENLQSTQRQLHKRKVSRTIDNLLMNRPTTKELFDKNIYNNDSLLISATDSLLAASQPSQPQPNNNSNLNKSNINKKRASETLTRKLRQRPSIDETVARGILLHRTDTNKSHGLEEAHRQLHKRKASMKLENLFKSRPTDKDLTQKGILISNEQHMNKKKHKRKTSMDLESGLKKRKSILELQQIGLLFKDGINELNTFNNLDDPQIDDDMMDDDEMNTNMAGIAGLFKSKPRTSKPLQETDFVGIEFNNKRRGSIDKIKPDPSTLTKKEKMAKIQSKLIERPTVYEMKSRGLLFEHPAVSKSLILRKKDLMKRRASNKVDSLLKHRPNRKELENKNILLPTNDSLEKRKRHKSKKSMDLENLLKHRPKAMKKDEAIRQRKKSMTDKDFRPDYLDYINSSLFDDDEDEMDLFGGSNGPQMQLETIRFLNIGGMVIPFVSPNFMNELHGNDPFGGMMSGIGNDLGNDLGNLFGMDDGDDIRMSQREFQEMQHKLNGANDKIEELEEDIHHQRAIVLDRDRSIQSLKESNAELVEINARQSLVTGSDIHKALQSSSEQKRIDKLAFKIQQQKSYIDKLSFYFKENKDIDLPTHKELKAAIKNKLSKNLRNRPQVSALQDSNILSSNFVSDHTNQKAQIAVKKLKFRRTSQLISSFLAGRPDLESLKNDNEHIFSVIDELDNEHADNEHHDEYKEYMDNTLKINNWDIEDNATKTELRLEINRLNNLLGSKIISITALEKQNLAMSLRIVRSKDDNQKNLNDKLSLHTHYETQIMDQTCNEIKKESDDKKIRLLQDRIRKLSSTPQDFNGLDEVIQEYHDSNDDIMSLVNWSRENLDLQNLFNNNNEDNDLELMKFVIVEYINSNKRKYNEYEFKLEKLQKELSKIKHQHKISMDIGYNNGITFNNPAAALHALQNPEANEITKLQKKLEKQKMEHLKDKEKFALNTINELNRLRLEIKSVGIQQQKNRKIIQTKDIQLDNAKKQRSYYSMITSNASYYLGKK